jgi:hypothetical protein
MDTNLWEEISPEIGSGANRLILVEESQEESLSPESPVPSVRHKGLAALVESTVSTARRT